MKKIGILGSGIVGKVLANGFLQHGYAVMIGTRDPDKLADWKAAGGANAHLGSATEAAQFGDIIVLADRTAVERELAAGRLQLRRIDAELAATPMTPEPAEDPALYAEAQAQYQAHRQALLDAIAQEQQAGERAAKELIAARATERKLERTLPSYERSAAAYEKLASQQQVGTIQAEEQRDGLASLRIHG